MGYVAFSLILGHMLVKLDLSRIYMFEVIQHISMHVTFVLPCEVFASLKLR